MIDEGYIKYSANRRDGDVEYTQDVRNLSMVRTTLFNEGLIGVYENGIGFGNVSYRIDEHSFVISGSATGGEMVLKPEQFAIVESFDLEKNSVNVVGKIDASSESMSHGAVYEAMPEVNTVIHVHSRKIFDYMLEKHYPKTPKEITFGTPELATSIKKVILGNKSPNGVLVTEGHDEGVIVYAVNLDIAYDLINALNKKSK
ncbi:MAG: class II aldolase/adducin family protein [Planctomycetaceae bacterium]|nr:class II aldolase/adducin family protein [Planctomycetaceae bacterium]